jgi:hypothetical protein
MGFELAPRERRKLITKLNKGMGRALHQTEVLDISISKAGRRMNLKQQGCIS